MRTPRRVVQRQNVSEEKLGLARHLRSTMTDPERILWHLLRCNRLPGWHFRRQQVVRGYILDFYCHRAGLAIELDGEGHDPAYDSDRDLFLRKAGVETIRFSNDEVIHNLDSVLATIKVELSKRKLPPLPGEG